MRRWNSPPDTTRGHCPATLGGAQTPRESQFLHARAGLQPSGRVQSEHVRRGAAADRGRVQKLWRGRTLGDVCPLEGIVERKLHLDELALATPFDRQHVDTSVVRPMPRATAAATNGAGPTKRDELLFLVVRALPKASSNTLASSSCCCTGDSLRDISTRFCTTYLADSVLPAPLSPLCAPIPCARQRHGMLRAGRRAHKHGPYVMTTHWFWPKLRSSCIAAVAVA